MWTEEEIYLISELAYEIGRQGCYADALALFEGLAAVAPGAAYARCGVASMRLRLGQPAEAVASLGQHADAASARLRLEGWLQLGRRQEAAREYQSLAPRLEPGERQRYVLLLEGAQLAGAGSDN